MSKAFTSEDSGVPEPPLKRDARLKPGARYFTPEGLEELRGRALELRRQLEPAGARPERGRRASAEQRAQLDALEALAASAVVVTPDAGAAKIGFGTWVDLEDEDGRELRYRIVGPDEANPKAGRLSVESPLAVALLGKAPGDEAQVELPKGLRTYLIKRIGV